MINFRVKNKKGLSLMETIINVYIYTLLIMVCVMVAITYIKTRVEIRQRQQVVEELSMTMNEMAKKIRMSGCEYPDSVIGSSCASTNFGLGNAIRIIPNDGSGSLLYYVGFYILAVNGEIMMEDVGGKFSVINNSNDEIPLITIELWKLDKKTHQKISGTTVKTSVSLRSSFEATIP